MIGLRDTSPLAAIQDPVGIRGWAIPAATDIAFALGVLALFGTRAPLGLRVFLMTLAVLDAAPIARALAASLGRVCDPPVFAFANAGVSLERLSFADLLEPNPLGIVLGLVIGKQLGVFMFSAAAIRLGVAQLPEGVDLRQIYGASLLCGIGFTMSLFIASLAFEGPGTDE